MKNHHCDERKSKRSDYFALEQIYCLNDEHFICIFSLYAPFRITVHSSIQIRIINLSFSAKCHSRLQTGKQMNSVGSETHDRNVLHIRKMSQQTVHFVSLSCVCKR